MRQHTACLDTSSGLPKRLMLEGREEPHEARVLDVRPRAVNLSLRGLRALMWGDGY